MNRTTFFYIFLSVLMFSTLQLSAIWESEGLYGGRMMSAVRLGDNLFAGTFGGGPGIHKSTDNGTSWTLIAEDMQTTQLFTDGTSLYAVSWYVIYRSDDAGESWVPISPEMGSIWAFHFIEFSGDYLFFFNKNKVYRTISQNPTWASWEDVSGVFTSENYIISSVAVQNNSIIVGVEYPNVVNKGGFFRSTDFGNSWTQINNGYGLWAQGNLLTDRFPSVWALEYHEGILFAGIRKFNGTPQGLWKSMDNGDSWVHVGFLNDTEVRSIFSFNGNIYVGTSQDGIYKSTNGGNSWNLENGELNIHQYFLVRQMLEGTNGNIVAITDISILISEDEGENWIVSNTGINELGIDAFGMIDEDIFVSSAEGGVFRSTDNGQSWTDINPNGITALTYVKAMETALWLSVSSDPAFAFTSGDRGDTWNLVFSPTGSSFQSVVEHNQYLYVTTNDDGDGIARSSDYGQTWETLSINNGAVAPKRLVSFGDAIYAGDWNTGQIWRTADDGQNWTATGANGFPWGASVTGNDDYVFISGDAVYSGIFRSNNNGETFTFLDDKGYIEVYDNFILQKWFDSVTEKWVTRRSYNNGDSWELVTNKFFGGNTYFLVEANNRLYALSGGQHYQSIDEGATWISISSPPVSDLRSDFWVKGTTIFQGTITSGLWNRSEPLPDLNTLAADEVTYSGATLNGTVNPNESICVVGFEYGLTTEYGQQIVAIPEVVSGLNPVFVTAELTDLEADKTYNYRVVATNANGLVYGPNRSFTTLMVGLDDSQEKKCQPEIFPNPVGDQLYINNAELVNRLVIINAMGQLVIDRHIDGTNTINTATLTDGVYMLKMQLKDNTSIVKRFIKN